MKIEIQGTMKTLSPEGVRYLVNDKWGTQTNRVTMPAAMDDSDWRDATAEEDAAIIEPQREEKTSPDFLDIMEGVERIAVRLSSLSDEEALEVMALFPTWTSKVGKAVDVGERLWHDGSLYKVAQAHTVQEDWKPTAAPALFVVVTNELTPEAGTIANPIAWEVGMIAEAGNYYIYDGVIYLCFRDSGTPLYYTPAVLTATYFEVVEP